MEPEAARAAAERFIRLHPQHPNVDYAYYLKGLSSFDQDRGLLARFLPLDMTKRDPGAARDSFNEFAQLTSRFPTAATPRTPRRAWCTCATCWRPTKCTSATTT